MSNPNGLCKMWTNCFSIRLKDMKKICEEIDSNAASEDEREMLSQVFMYFDEQFSAHLKLLERIRKALANDGEAA